jgi:hypothetical protein
LRVWARTSKVARGTVASVWKTVDAISVRFVRPQPTVFVGVNVSIARKGKMTIGLMSFWSASLKVG